MSVRGVYICCVLSVLLVCTGCTDQTNYFEDEVSEVQAQEQPKSIKESVSSCGDFIQDSLESFEQLVSDIPLDEGEKVLPPSVYEFDPMDLEVNKVIDSDNEPMTLKELWDSMWI